MDDDNRRRRQNETQYHGQDPRFSAGDRYRPTPPMSSPATSRGSAGYPAYYQEPTPFAGTLTTNSIEYQPSNYTQDQRQQQNFAAYAPDLMYNVPQQTPHSNVYDSASQFQARQPAAMQLLSDVAVPYYPHESNASSGPPGLQHHVSSGSSTIYPQQSPSHHQSYDSGLAMSGLQQNTSDNVADEEFQSEVPGMEEAYTRYQNALKKIYQNILDCRLMDAGKSLLEISEWLLGSVGDLDDVGLHSDRVRLWGEFNTAWLSIFQKQKDMLGSGQRLQSSQTLMTQDFINQMAKDLIRMCDSIEKHGLVDYQYGVAEEQIITILGECLDLQESIEGAPT